MFKHGMFKPLINNLIDHDPFCVMADIDSYSQAQEDVSNTWLDRKKWNTMSLINISNSGFFSSDRSIKDYCERIWDKNLYL